MKRFLMDMHPVKRLAGVTLLSLLVLALAVVWDNWGDLVWGQKAPTAPTPPTAWPRWSNASRPRT